MITSFDWNNTVRNIQVDITSYCNARCPGCARNNDGGDTIDGFVLQHFDLSLWKRLIEKDLSNIDIESINLNGNYGDPCMHPDLIEMMKYVALHHPSVRISIATNGSMQTPEWWKELAGVLGSMKSHTIHFAIDGMADTHNIYRKNTRFDKLCENIRAFTEAGGNADALMTIFNHNFHQIDNVKQLASELGCVTFSTRPSYKKVIIDVDHGNILATDIPSDYKRNRTIILDMEKRMKIHTSLNIRSKNIKDTSCIWYSQRRIQIDSYGLVTPCCWLPHNKSTPNTPGHNPDNPIAYAKAFDSSLYNLHKHSLRDILNTEWFVNILPSKINNNQYSMCNIQCGKK